MYIIRKANHAKWGTNSHSSINLQSICTDSNLCSHKIYAVVWIAVAGFALRMSFMLLHTDRIESSPCWPSLLNDAIYIWLCALFPQTNLVCSNCDWSTHINHSTTLVPMDGRILSIIYVFAPIMRMNNMFNPILLDHRNYGSLWSQCDVEWWYIDLLGCG